MSNHLNRELDTTGTIISTSKTIGEFEHCVEAILLLWLIAVVVLWAVSILRYLKFRKGDEMHNFFKGIEELVENCLPMFGIAILNIVTFGSYVYATFATFFGISLFLLMEVIEDKLPESRRGLIKLGVPSFFVISLYLNFWINDQTQA